MEEKNIGIYIHIPFCDGKCPYCDFYSKLPAHDETALYVSALRGRIRELSQIYKYNRKVGTVYFGGGTPNLIGANALSELLETVKSCFDISENAEITTEANPDSVDADFFKIIRESGFNRLSMGLQSANEDELKLLGRKHSASDVSRAVKLAQATGFDNISLDLMMGLPGGSLAKLKNSIDFCAALNIQHISSYILKIEERTVFGRKNIQLPDDDAVSDQYLFAVEELERLGYHQYEISNFSRAGCESRHNLKYWHCGEYLGIGPAAHSFMEGRRFFFNRNISDFINGCTAVQDGIGGDFEEYIMLGLRLTQGISRSGCEKFGGNLFDELAERSKKIPCDCINVTEDNISLTPKGFLISNTIIFVLLDLS
jgi:oxygen-independent coproporphyrinogen-3 oxidase